MLCQRSTQQAPSLCTVTVWEPFLEIIFSESHQFTNPECQRHADWPVIAVTAQGFEDKYTWLRHRVYGYGASCVMPRMLGPKAGYENLLRKHSNASNSWKLPEHESVNDGQRD